MAKVVPRTLILAAAYLWILPGISRADPVSDSHTSQTVNKTSRPHLDLQLSLAGSAFGPITYDRLGVFTGTGVAKRDPNYFSYEPSLKFESILGTGGLYLRLLWRHFQPMENNIDGRFKGDEEVSSSGKTTITSSGPGLELGWNFRKRTNPNVFFFPYLGLVAERNTVKIKGEQQDFGIATQSLNYTSTLEGVYSRLGIGWRPFTGFAELEIISGIYIPLWAEVRDGAANAAERGVGKRLHHGMRTGAFLAIATGISSGKYDQLKMSSRSKISRKKSRRRSYVKK